MPTSYSYSHSQADTNDAATPFSSDSSSTPVVDIEPSHPTHETHHTTSKAPVTGTSPVKAPNRPSLPSSPSPSSVHLVILQHGYLGSAHDMRLLSNILTSDGPDNLLILTAAANNKLNEDTIENTASRLSIEIVKFCLKYCPEILVDSDDSEAASEGRGSDEGNTTMGSNAMNGTMNSACKVVGGGPEKGSEKGEGAPAPSDFPGCRVSFIGHSMGGLVIRKALESVELKPMLTKLYLYISLATPHLGMYYTDILYIYICVYVSCIYYTIYIYSFVC